MNTQNLKDLLKEKKHLIWCLTLLIITFSICGTIIYLNSHPYIFEIGDNALEAIKSVNWSAINYG